MIKQQNKLGSL